MCGERRGLSGYRLGIRNDLIDDLLARAGVSRYELIKSRYEETIQEEYRRMISEIRDGKYDPEEYEQAAERDRRPSDLRLSDVV